ncbi:hypothetical protein [Asticcacaulis sp. EMRT-3]|uniref:hypothetical protein n=1 Tax=Asticcacaulis sp. EMRT-3 TaxID=3040349 RepID=UPI0024AF638C|nr:hypothetical protein [Asticcacaulis sp. EMRT-3]MDI7774782.1 hypothetical protein [Asticcacaulis sp. EMRT-3]
MTAKTIWLGSAAAAAFLVGISAAGFATANPIPPATSYADLLEPVPDARLRLAADDTMRLQGAHLLRTQYWVDRQDQDHHHHHHHHHSGQWYRDNGYSWDGGAWVLVPEYNRYHHHHHSWQWYNDNGYYWNGWSWTRRVDRDHHHHHNYHHHNNRW